MSTPPSLPPGDPGLGLVKEAVRALPAYTLDAPACLRKLNQNESPVDLPPALKQVVLTRLADEAWHRYPEFVPASLVEALGARHAWDPAGVLVGNGSNELMQALFAVTLGPGGDAVFPAPTFSLYRLLVGVLGAAYHPVPLGSGFRYEVGALISAARTHRARLVLVCSPNNPTGSTIGRADVERLLAETDALVVCDEAYQEFGGESAAPLLHETSRLVVLRTFSKAFGLAGLRFGYALAHPEVAAEIAKAKLPYNVNRLTLAAADTLLAHPEAFDARVEELVTRRGTTIAALRAIPGLTVYDSAANFFLIRAARWPADHLLQRLLAGHGILLRDVSAGPGLEGCLRVSVGTAEDMAALEAALIAILGAG